MINFKISTLIFQKKNININAVFVLSNRIKYFVILYIKHRKIFALPSYIFLIMTILEILI